MTTEPAASRGATPAATVFEQPLTERVRSCLRLEFLFAQLAHHRGDASEFGTRATLHTLLDILALLSRSDVRGDLLKELSDQQSALTRLGQRPEVDGEALSQVLGELGQAVGGLQRLPNQYAAGILRENDFLTSVANRYAMPGGTCGFDLPLLHFWLHQPEPVRHRTLAGWIEPLLAVATAIGLYLRLLRESRAPEKAVASQGIYIHRPEEPCHLLRVHVPVGIAAFPEISASRHRFSLRFMTVTDVNQRPIQLAVDLPFQLQSCAL